MRPCCIITASSPGELGSVSPNPRSSPAATSTRSNETIPLSVSPESRITNSRHGSTAVEHRGHGGGI